MNDEVGKRVQNVVNIGNKSIEGDNCNVQKEMSEWERIKYFIQMTRTGNFIFDWLMILMMLWLIYAMIFHFPKREVFELYASMLNLDAGTLIGIFGLVMCPIFFLTLSVALSWVYKGRKQKLRQEGYSEEEIRTQEVWHRERYGVEYKSLGFISRNYGMGLPTELGIVRKEIRSWVEKQGGSTKDGVFWLLKQEVKRYLAKIRRNS